MIRSVRLRLICSHAVVIAGIVAEPALGDPFPNQTLKFQQLPLDNLTYPVGDPISGFIDATYWGHDELSTAYNTGPGPGGPAPVYIGTFMADDFADRFTTPVVHVRWWGSYPRFNPDFPVNRFLISFEEDVPANPAAGAPFSRPGRPLLNQVVTRGPLAPGSGTFTEQPISPGGPPLNEALYQYNAELNLGQEFYQKPDTVYWIKIVALIDAPGVIIDPSQPLPPFLTQWGWHDRDYTKMNALASTAPAVTPGEHLDFFVPSTPGVAAYHFQDNAISGSVVVDFNPQPGPAPLFPVVTQDPLMMQPQRYINNVDGPGVGQFGLPGIDQYSKDLAFELYTIVPEPTGLALLGAITPFVFRFRSRRRTRQCAVARRPSVLC